MEITSPSGKIYVVGEELGKNERFKLYHCIFEENQVCILKIARKPAFNGLLDREAFILETMKKEADAIEAEYGEIRKPEEPPLNYHYFFPQLIETFVSAEQNGSRIIILSQAHIASDLNKLKPISHLITRDNVRVDPKTSAWILGKLLKLLVFTHSQNITIGDLDGSNILINGEQHYVSIFDWSDAIIGNGQMPENVAANEVSQVAREITLILGGDLATGELPKDKQLEDTRYEDFIKNLFNESEPSAKLAHQKFYELIESLWPRGFHKFNTYYLTT
jgi:hypothetical protein